MVGGEDSASNEASSPDGVAEKVRHKKQGLVTIGSGRLYRALTRRNLLYYIRNGREGKFVSRLKWLGWR